MPITSRPSPNFDSRDGHSVDMLVLHYTGMPTEKDALDRLCDGSARVSAHYVVNEEGEIFRLVDETDRAWHAGKSFWRGATNINQRSIGIEIVNPGHEFGYRPFPRVQMDAVAQICRDILSRQMIPARNVVAHADVAPQRKEDPGELFDWAFLAERGIGLWPRDLPQIMAMRMVPPAEMQRKLLEYGYECPQSGTPDEATRKVIVAFQRHFRPAHLNGVWDGGCAVLLDNLLSQAYNR